MDILCVCVISVEEVLGSLRSVKSVYQRELQQVLDGEKNSTGKYKPQWRWFHFLDSFLRNHILQKVQYIVSLVD